MADVKHNLQAGGGLYLDKWWTGLYTNRSPIFTPISAMGLQIIERQDTLIGGLNVTCSPRLTLKRRYGHSKACSSQFGVSEWPLTYASFTNLGGVAAPMVDTQVGPYSFTAGALNLIYTKTGGAGQSSMVPVLNTLYWVDGTVAKQWWQSTTVWNMGIASPVNNNSNRFSASATGVGSLTVVTGWNYVYVYKNSSTGHISNASNLNSLAGVGGIQTGIASLGPASSFASVSLSHIQTSSDSQVNDVDIYRTKDGGSVYYYLATISNGTSTYSDSTPDTGLNTLLIAPITHTNDPPPTGLSLLCWYAGRLWGAVGNTLYYSGGPDTTNGVGQESWPPGNNYTLPGAITALVATTEGLIIMVADNAYVTTGTTSATFTVPRLWQANFGVAGVNSITQDGDNVYFFTSRKQVWSYGANGLQELGFNIRDKLASMAPSSVYMTVHRNGTDEGLFISDGSANMYRYSTVNGGWDTVTQPANGCSAIGSIETTIGNWALLVGRPTGSGFILQRDTTLYQDDGSSYGANAIVGSLVVAPPRQVANIASVLIDAPVVGVYPTISVLMNEVIDQGVLPATFVPLPNPVPDPPQLALSKTIWMKRHDFKAAQSPLSGHMRHLQVKIDFGTQNAANELYGLGLA